MESSPFIVSTTEQGVVIVASSKDYYNPTVLEISWESWDNIMAFVKAYRNDVKALPPINKLRIPSYEEMIPPKRNE